MARRRRVRQREARRRQQVRKKAYKPRRRGRTVAPVNYQIKPTAPRRNKRKPWSYSEDRDKKYTALPPGKRISANGNIYYEHRKNRSDLGGRT